MNTQFKAAIESIIAFPELLTKMWKYDDWKYVQGFLHGAAMIQESVNSEIYKELTFLREVWFIVKH